MDLIWESQKLSPKEVATLRGIFLCIINSFDYLFHLDMKGSVKEKEVCIGIVTQIDLLTYITRKASGGKVGLEAAHDSTQLVTQE